MSGSMRRLVAMLMALAALGACAAPVPGAPSPAGSAASTDGAPASAVTDAPRVPNPRDVRGIAACDLLTPAQLNGFGLDPATAKASTQNTALNCGWRTRDGLGSVNVTAGTQFNVNGLDGLYLLRETYGVFEPGEMDGFPIVRAERNDSRSTGDNYCTIYVGVADEQLVWAATGYLKPTPPACDTSRAVMATVLTNLPPLT